MKIKIIGIGKCGSRLAYDFFAYISDTPTAYELRARQSSKFLSYLTNRYPSIASIDRRVTEIGITRQQLYQDLFGQFLIFDPAVLVTIDSDSRNNEIIRWIQFINKEGRSYIFPGKSYPLANHEGGCDYHIISETLCTNWHNIDEEIINDEGADFLVTAFSIGGGTGGGSGPIISHKCKQRFKSRARSGRTTQMHFMGAGVLPISDEPYRGEDFVPDMVASEKYNTGRFFTRLYGYRNMESPELYVDSVWLISNDTLRVALKEMQTEKESKEPNLSLINKYLSASLTAICNASSGATQSEPNFDPSEMNSRLNGYPFISGYATATPEKTSDSKLFTNSLRAILKSALSNATINNAGQLQGLSMPVRESELEEVSRILDEKGLERLQSSLRTYDLAKAPLEFRTASRVILLFGQPKDTHSPYKDNLIREITSTLFQNSNLDTYYYKHPGAVEVLLILIVNPFIRFIQKAMYYYTDISWVNGMADDDIFDEVLVEQPFNEGKMGQLLASDEEQILSSFHGENIVQLVKNFDNNVSRLKREHVISAFRHLHNVLHHKKTIVGRTSRI